MELEEMKKQWMGKWEWNDKRSEEVYMVRDIVNKAVGDAIGWWDNTLTVGSIVCQNLQSCHQNSVALTQKHQICFWIPSLINQKFEI